MISSSAAGIKRFLLLHKQNWRSIQAGNAFAFLLSSDTHLELPMWQQPASAAEVPHELVLGGEAKYREVHCILPDTAVLSAQTLCGLCAFD